MQLDMRLVQGRVTPQGTYAEFASAESEGPHREAWLKVTIAPDEMGSLDFGKPYRLTVEEVG